MLFNFSIAFIVLILAVWTIDCYLKNSRKFGENERF